LDDLDKPSSLQDLDRRLKAVRERRRQAEKPGRSAISSRGMNLGFRIAVELLAALVVGVGLGVVLDDWLGTAPWLLILGFFLGSGAALNNVMRTAKELEAARRREQAQQGRSGGAPDGPAPKDEAAGPR
jgi:ATP synthase protein I